MPNNTMNILVAEETYFNNVIKDGKLDFSRFLPEPNLLINGTTSDKLAIKEIHESVPFPSEEYSDDDITTLGEVLIGKTKNEDGVKFDKDAIVTSFNERTFGISDWWSFRNSFWGSKWGAYGQDKPIRAEKRRHGIHYFETAWGYGVHPIAVTSYYASKPVVLYSICEGGWFVSRSVFSGGKLVSHLCFHPDALPEEGEGSSKWFGRSLISESALDDFIENYVGYTPKEVKEAKENNPDAYRDIEEGINRALDDPSSVVSYFVRVKNNIHPIVRYLDNLFTVLQEHTRTQEIRVEIPTNVDRLELEAELSNLSNRVIKGMVMIKETSTPILYELLTENQVLSWISGALQIKHLIFGSILSITVTTIRPKALPSPKTEGK